MSEEPLSNREIIAKFQNANEKMESFDHDARDSLSRIETSMETGFKGVHDRQDTTNGRIYKAEQELSALRLRLYIALTAIVVILALKFPDLLNLLKIL